MGVACKGQATFWTGSCWVYPGIRAFLIEVTALDEEVRRVSDVCYHYDKIDPHCPSHCGYLGADDTGVLFQPRTHQHRLPNQNATVVRGCLLRFVRAVG